MEFYHLNTEPQTLNSAEAIWKYLEKYADKLNNYFFRASIQFWKLSKRPYYLVYPKIVEALLRVELDFKLPTVTYPTPEQSVLIRFAKGFELCGVIKTLLVSPFYYQNENQRLVCLFADCLDNSWSYIVNGYNNETIRELICHSGLDNLDAEQVRQCFKLAVGVSLLDTDPELVVPDVLSSDRTKLLNNTDPQLLVKLIDKAKRRGKFGWAIGKCTLPTLGNELPPHYRRPHFSVRWTGKGHSIPKLCLIKGSIIHRNSVLKVPTGYLDKENQDASSSQASKVTE